MARVEIKTNAQLHHMSRAGIITSRALDEAVAAAKPGVSTAELNKVFERSLKEQGGISNFYGYYDYPASICTSVNHEVVHGIPGDYILQDGDIISIDGGAYIIDPATKKQWHGDSARTVLVGHTSQTRRDLSNITREALWHGIAALAHAKKIGEVGIAIEEFVRSETGNTYGIIEDYVGHGIGTHMHMAPDVLNYAARDLGPKIKPGMAFAIEPMLVTGNTDTTVLEDDWTVITTDRSDACQWEHSVAVHRDGIWVLTAEDGGASELARFGIIPVPIPK